MCLMNPYSLPRPALPACCQNLINRDGIVASEAALVVESRLFAGVKTPLLWVAGAKLARRVRMMSLTALLRQVHPARPRVYN